MAEIFITFLTHKLFITCLVKYHASAIVQVYVLWFWHLGFRKKSNHWFRIIVNNIPFHWKGFCTLSYKHFDLKLRLCMMQNIMINVSIKIIPSCRKHFCTMQVLGTIKSCELYNLMFILVNWWLKLAQMKTRLHNIVHSILIVAELKTTEVLSNFHLHNHFVPEWSKSIHILSQTITLLLL